MPTSFHIHSDTARRQHNRLLQNWCGVLPPFSQFNSPARSSNSKPTDRQDDAFHVLRAVRSHVHVALRDVSQEGRPRPSSWIWAVGLRTARLRSCTLVERHHTGRERRVREISSERSASCRARWPLGSDSYGWCVECGCARDDHGRRGSAGRWCDWCQSVGAYEQHPPRVVHGAAPTSK